MLFSRTICKYLTEKYGSTAGPYSKDRLYPRDLQKRATIDHRIDFDLGALYRRVSDYFVSNRSVSCYTYVIPSRLISSIRTCTRFEFLYKG